MDPFEIALIAVSSTLFVVVVCIAAWALRRATRTLDEALHPSPTVIQIS
jgi:hypothetical protein